MFITPRWHFLVFFMSSQHWFVMLDHDFNLNFLKNLKNLNIRINISKTETLQITPWNFLCIFSAFCHDVVHVVLFSTVSSNPSSCLLTQVFKFRFVNYTLLRFSILFAGNKTKYGGIISLHFIVYLQQNNSQ